MNISLGARTHWRRIAWPHTSWSSHPEQGWSLLCNGVVVFDDAGALLPDGRVVDPRADETLTPCVLVEAA